MESILALAYFFSLASFSHRIHSSLNALIKIFVLVFAIGRILYIILHIIKYNNFESETELYLAVLKSIIFTKYHVLYLNTMINTDILLMRYVSGFDYYLQNNIIYVKISYAYSVAVLFELNIVQSLLLVLYLLYVYFIMLKCAKSYIVEEILWTSIITFIILYLISDFNSCVMFLYNYVLGLLLGFLIILINSELYNDMLRNYYFNHRKHLIYKNRLPNYSLTVSSIENRLYGIIFPIILYALSYFFFELTTFIKLNLIFLLSYPISLNLSLHPLITEKILLKSNVWAVSFSLFIYFKIFSAI